MNKNKIETVMLYFVSSSLPCRVRRKKYASPACERMTKSFGPNSDAVSTIRVCDSRAVQVAVSIVTDLSASMARGLDVDSGCGGVIMVSSVGGRLRDFGTVRV
jgi:hypothetical protein